MVYSGPTLPVLGVQSCLLALVLIPIWPWIATRCGKQLCKALKRARTVQGRRYIESLFARILTCEMRWIAQKTAATIAMTTTTFRNPSITA